LFLILQPNADRKNKQKEKEQAKGKRTSKRKKNKQKEKEQAKGKRTSKRKKNKQNVAFRATAIDDSASTGQRFVQSFGGRERVRVPGVGPAP
jgi:hypothetical protein